MHQHNTPPKGGLEDFKDIAISNFLHPLASTGRTSAISSILNLEDLRSGRNTHHFDLQLSAVISFQE